MTVSPTSDVVYYGSNCGSICAYEASSGKAAKLSLGDKAIVSISSIPNLGVQVGLRDKTLRLLDFNLQNEKKVELPGFIVSHTVSSGRLYVAMSENRIAIIDPKVGTVSKVETVKTEKGGGITSVCGTPGGALLAVAYEGKGTEVTIQTAPRPVVLYNVTKPDAIEVVATNPIEDFQGDIFAMAFSTDGSQLACGDSKKKIAVLKNKNHGSGLLSMFSGGSVPDFQLIPGTDKWSGFHTAKINAMCFDPSGNKLVTGSLDRSCIVWDVTNPAGNRETLKEAHKEGVTGVGYLPGSGKLVTVGMDCCVKVYG